jgi:lipoate-protein ligase A
MDLPQFWKCIKDALTTEGITEIHLPEESIAAIRKLQEEKYDTWQWNFGKSPKFQMHNRRRHTGGLLDIHLSVDTGAISEIRIFGDFLALLPVSDLEEVIEGCAYEENALITALSDIDLVPYLGIITLQELVDTICNK